MTITNAALLAAALLFLLFVVGQALLPAIVRRGPRRAAHTRLSAAVAKGTDTALAAPERAAALREASTIALDGIQKPRLAARYARWADQALPGHPETIELLARTMARAGRYSALEKTLWRTLDAHPGAHDAARDALIALYEGPLHAPERARVLRRLSTTLSAAPPAATTPAAATSDEPRR